MIDLLTALSMDSVFYGFETLKLNTMGKFITLREEFESETGAHAFADKQYIEWLEKIVERQRQVKNCSIPDVVKSLPNDEQIADAADHWVFDVNGNKWSNNNDTAGDNYGSFKAGVKWLKERLAK